LFHKALVLPFGDGRVVLSFSGDGGDGGNGCYINTTPFLLPNDNGEGNCYNDTSPSFSNNGGNGCCNDTTPFLLPTVMVEWIVITTQHLSFFLATMVEAIVVVSLL